MSAPKPSYGAIRYADLLKQGFMKPLKPRRVAKPKVVKPVVACNACRNWHTEGKHTADAATRKANLRADK